MDAAAATYSEVRWWAVWLDTFTASDLAQAMGVSYEVGRRGIKALLWHGIVLDTGDTIDGPEGPEQIITYKPLPPGPRFHPHETPPEIAVPGAYSLAPPRGRPVPANLNGASRRRVASTPGQAKKLRDREAARAAMEAAQKARAEKQKNNATRR